MNKYQDASYDSHNRFIFCLYVFLQEITNVQAHYEQIKQACHVSASVSVTPVDLPAQLEERALEFQQWQENNKVSECGGLSFTQVYTAFPLSEHICIACDC